MTENNLPHELSLFLPSIRRHWYNNEWFYSIVDIVACLTESKDSGAYWRNLKKRLIEDEGAREIHEGTFDISIQVHKKYKLIPTKANLRDHMTHLELALTSLSEATAITLHQKRDSQGFSKLKKDAVDAGEAGSKARKVVEESIGEPVVSPQNYLGHTKQKRLKSQHQLSLFDEFNEDS
jgi:hypothetical protein